MSDPTPFACPACGTVQDKSAECRSCGVVYARWSPPGWRSTAPGKPRPVVHEPLAGLNLRRIAVVAGLLLVLVVGGVMGVGAARRGALRQSGAVAAADAWIRSHGRIRQRMGTGDGQALVIDRLHGRLGEDAADVRLRLRGPAGAASIRVSLEADAAEEDGWRVASAAFESPLGDGMVIDGPRGRRAADTTKRGEPTGTKELGGGPPADPEAAEGSSALTGAGSRGLTANQLLGMPEGLETDIRWASAARAAKREQLAQERAQEQAGGGVDWDGLTERLRASAGPQEDQEAPVSEADGDESPLVGSPMKVEGATPSAMPGWYLGAEGLQKAQAERATRPVPLVLYFHADWCGYCKRFESEFLSHERARRYLGNMARVELNPERSEAERDIARSYGVTGYPTFLVLPAESTTATRVHPFKAGTAAPISTFVAELLKAAGMEPS